jgi:hypothetical protein
MDTSEIKTGMPVRVIANRGGHGYPVGTGRVYFVSSTRSGSAMKLREGLNSTMDSGAWVYPDEIEPAFSSRAEAADFYETIANELTEKAEMMKTKVAGLREYESDEDEVAGVLAKVIQSGGKLDDIKKACKMLGLKRVA